ncbi:MAG: polyphosphate kinase 1 [Deltaproteobacteria bacterium]|nr:polyphosphate kinase 1 [Deltaproteobacteria bacterium]
MTQDAEEAAPPTEAGPPALSDAQLFLNRELSWLEFNQRVLDEAADPSLPAYERLKFLGITASNLDEFFMVRVAGLKSQIAEGVTDAAADGMLPEEQLRAVGARAHRMVLDQYRLWREEVLPALTREHGIQLVKPRDLSAAQKGTARDYFRLRVFPVLTPLANDRSHPFPQLRNKSLTLAVHLPAKGRRRLGGTTSLVGVPAALPRLVPAGDGRTFVLLEDLIAEHVGDLLAGSPEVKSAAFRITRNWDLEVDEEEWGDLLSAIQAGVRERDKGEPVRLELVQGTPAELTQPLVAQLALHEPDVYEVDGPLQLQDMVALVELTRGDRRQKPRAGSAPVPSILEQASSVFEAISRRDILLHHPYDSFEPVIRFIEEAADDPDVKAVKQVLYRTGADSPFVKALLRAAEAGKEVAVFLEIQARFDENNNIGWVRKLRDAGAVVVYGYDACKTHCKTALVVRSEDGLPRRYVHLGTGNYNPITARIYTDVSLLTARPDVAEEVGALFNMLTANSTAAELQLSPESRGPWKRLGVAPHGLKQRILDLVREETEQAAAGKPARILAKMNSLVDPQVIRALYEASQAGVTVDLLVRGICCLRPGVPGVSERIRVQRVVDRFLEHSRIFVFGEGKRSRTFISSADWMPRNFHKRVELLVPIDDPESRARLQEILDAGLADNVKGARLLPDGSYERLRPAEGAPAIRSQDLLDSARRARSDVDLKPLLERSQGKE